MLERRMRRGREEVDFTGGIVRSFFFFCFGEFVGSGFGRTFLGECFLVIEDTFEFVYHVEDFI
jgi:hypothetical protein